MGAKSNEEIRVESLAAMKPALEQIKHYEKVLAKATVAGDSPRAVSAQRHLDELGKQVDDLYRAMAEANIRAEAAAR